VLYAFGIYGKWSRYPLRWSEAYFSPNQAVAALALNPVLYLSDSTGNPTRPYDLAKVREHYGFVSSLLGVQAPDPQKLEYGRRRGTSPRQVQPRRDPPESFAPRSRASYNRLQRDALLTRSRKTGFLHELLRSGRPTARWCSP
jgi:hypothetical protein